MQMGAEALKNLLSAPLKLGAKKHFTRSEFY